VAIQHNAMLTSLDGLGSLSSIDNEIRIVGNNSLTNIEGLSSLTKVGLNSITQAYYSLIIDGNAALESINGLRNLDDIPGQVGITNNDALVNLDGLEKTEVYDHSLVISGNDALVDINGLSKAKSVSSGIVISNNASLPNLDGLRSLTAINGGAGVASFIISNNTSLTNVDSLSALATMRGTPARLTVTDNINLTRGCGFYNMLNVSFCDGCWGEATFSNNGPGITKDEILAAGPCGDVETGPNRPTNLVFSNVTENSMEVSFTPGSGANGYLTLMRTFESSLPDDAPEDVKEYHVGDVIGCCSIVIGVGAGTTFNPIYLDPDMDYHFDIIPYTGAYGTSLPNYFPEQALSGHQKTLSPTQPYPNPFMEELTIPVTVTEANTTVRISITDQLGRSVSEITQTLNAAGKHEIRWNRADHQGNRVMNGVYTYSIITPNNSVKGLVMAK